MMSRSVHRDIGEMYPTVPHYYGDITRQLMLLAVGLMVVGWFVSDELRTAFPIEIVGGLLAIGFAALTNPFKRWIVVGDAIICGCGAALFELAAYASYQSQNTLGVVVCEAIAILFLLAFYFSLKTLRAMILHQVGKPDSALEFRRSADESIVKEWDAEAQSAHSPLEKEEAYNPNFMGDN